MNKRYNPYCLLNPSLLKAIIKQPHFFVRHYYSRGEMENETEKKIPLLFSHYSQHEIDRERAFRHMRLLKKDPYRFLYDSTNPVHREKLLHASAQPDGYRIYTNVLPQKWEAGRDIKRKVYAYLEERFPSVQNIQEQKLHISLQDLYGKLYLFLRWKATTVEVLMDDIEKIDCHVL